MKNNIIPKISPEQFQYNDWNAGYCETFYEFYNHKEEIRDNIIGWCKSSHLKFRPQNDDEYIAIMLKDNTWCHMPMYMIEEYCGEDMKTFWNFEGFEVQDD